LAEIVAVKATPEPKDGVVEETVRTVVVVAGATVTVTGLETEAAKLCVPAYLAVIESAPLGRVERLIVATPLLFTVPVPIAVAPSMKVTTPEVAGLPLADTVAVMATLAPKAGLVVATVSDVVVVVRATSTVTGGETEPAKLCVPAKLAVIELAPLGRVERLIVAIPALFTVPVPIAVAPFRNVTMPEVAGPPFADTVAVKATLDPKDGVVEDALMVVVVVSGATVTMTGLETEAA
jgi:hypothetical protein